MEILFLFDIGGVLITGNKARDQSKTYIEVLNKKYHCVSIGLQGIEHTVDRGSPPVNLEITLPQRYGVLNIGDRLFDVIKEGALIRRNLFLQDELLNVTNLRTDIYRIGRIKSRTNTRIRTEITDEQQSWNDFALADRPGRCHWTYRGEGCGYTGRIYYDADDNFTNDRSKDVCGLRIRSCERRFPNGPLPFGGMPESIQEVGR